MTRTLREAKAKLSELVEAASRGEEIGITVRGTVKARLVAPLQAPSRQEREAWVKELRAFQRKSSTGKPGPSIQDILDELREDRA